MGQRYSGEHLLEVGFVDTRAHMQLELDNAVGAVRLATVALVYSRRAAVPRVPECTEGWRLAPPHCYILAGVLWPSGAEGQGVRRPSIFR